MQPPVYLDWPPWEKNAMGCNNHLKVNRVPLSLLAPLSSSVTENNYTADRRIRCRFCSAVGHRCFWVIKENLNRFFFLYLWTGQPVVFAPVEDDGRGHCCQVIGRGRWLSVFLHVLFGSPVHSSVPFSCCFPNLKHQRKLGFIFNFNRHHH